MKGYFKSVMRVMFALLVGMACFSSCSKDDDEDKEKQTTGKSNSTTAEAFYNGYKNNKEMTILVDMRTRALYEAGHIDGAVNIDCESSDEAFYNENATIYRALEELDPKHEKYIQLYDSKGASQFTIKVASVISKKGWGEKQVFLLAGKYSDFAAKYPDIIVK